MQAVPTYALLTLSDHRRKKILAWLADPAASPAHVQQRILDQFALLFAVEDLIAFRRLYTDGAVWLRPKDIAAREGRSARWAREKISAGEFGDIKCVGAHLLEVRESAYLAWLERSIRKARGPVADADVRLPNTEFLEAPLAPSERTKFTGRAMISHTAGMAERKSRATWEAHSSTP